MHSKAPATCPYPEPARSSPCPYIPLPEDPFNPLNAKLNPILHLLALLGAHPILHVSRITFNIISHLRLGLPSGLFSLGFLTKTPYTPKETSNMQ
jgi:hypothetical protein